MYRKNIEIYHDSNNILDDTPRTYLTKESIKNREISR